MSWLMLGFNEPIRVRWWKSSAFCGFERKQRIKSWNAIEFEIIRLTSSYCEYRLLKSFTVFWRFRMSFSRQKQLKKLRLRSSWMLLRSITDDTNFYIFYSTPRIGPSLCVWIFCASICRWCCYLFVSSCAKTFSFRSSLSKKMAEIGAMKNVSSSLKPS